MPKEKMRRLNAALDAIDEGRSQAQLDEMTAAMTEDHIEAWKVMPGKKLRLFRHEAERLPGG